MKELPVTTTADGVKGSLLSLILDVIPYVVFWKDRNSVFLGCNRHFVQLAGLDSPADVVGLTDYDLPWSREESDSYRADDALVMASGESKLHIVETLCNADGKRTWLDTSKVPLRDHAGNVIGVLGIFADITDAKDAEERLRETRQHLEDAIQAIDAGLVMYDANERLIFCNEVYRRIYAEAEPLLVPGRSYEEILTAFAVRRPDLLRGESATDWAAARLRQHRLCERWEKNLGDHVILVSDRRTADGGIVGLHTDISIEKQRQHELNRAKEEAIAANVAKTNFLANLSHEIRTPMSAILGFSELLANSAPRPDQMGALETIQRNATHLLDLIDDILDLSRIEVGKLRVDCGPVDPTVLVRDIATLMTERAVAKGLRFDVDFGDRLPATIDTDATRLRQILVNLIGNAIKFTAHGHVKLTVRPSSPDTACRTLLFRVEDTGIGIAAHNLQRVFEPFEQADASTTRRYGGAGLGLAISRHLARLLGGDIDAASELGAGAVFTVSHPVPDAANWIDPRREPDAPPPTPAAAEPMPSLAGRSVLLVEDGPDNRRLLTKFLESAGARVAFAVDGVEALESVAAAEADGTPFDAILMDMQMPRLDGYEATQQLRARGCKLPIVALTAHAMTGDRERCIEAGCDDYLTKPVPRRKLLEVIASWVGRP